MEAVAPPAGPRQKRCSLAELDATGCQAEVSFFSFPDRQFWRSGALAWMSFPDPVPTPTPPPRYAYVPLTDEEWSMVAPHWPTFNQAKTGARDIVNALLMIASTGCVWNDVAEFATGEAIHGADACEGRNFGGGTEGTLNAPEGDLRLGDPFPSCCRIAALLST